MKPLRYAITAIAVFILGAILYYLGTHLDAVSPFMSGMIMMFLPILLGVWLIRKYNVRWTTFFIGVGTFVVSQVLHIPFNAFLLNPYVKELGWELEAGTTGLIGIALLFGLSAGLFEETARYIAMHRWAKDARHWKDGLMFGAGHGGMEAFLVGAGAFYVFLQAAVLRGADINLMATSPAEVASLQTFVETYWGQQWYLHLIGVLERVSAMAFHISAAVMVMRAVTRQRPSWVYIAIGWHTVLNAIGVYGLISWGAIWTEVALLTCGLLSVIFVYLLREPIPLEIADDAPLEPTPTHLLRPATADDLNLEDLEGSRYD